jgi:hypothetical protein
MRGRSGLWLFAGAVVALLVGSVPAAIVAGDPRDLCPSYHDEVRCSNYFAASWFASE